MRALEFMTGHVIYNPAYNYKFQLKTPIYLDNNPIFRWVNEFQLYRKTLMGQKLSRLDVWLDQVNNIIIMKACSNMITLQA